MNSRNKDRIPDLIHRLKDLPPEQMLAVIAAEFPGKVMLASSLGPEDQVLTHMIAAGRLRIGIFTLDTGRLFQETYSLMDRTREKYGIPLNVVFPDRREVEDMNRKHGVNLFYEDPDKRKLCCHIRKVHPSERVLKKLDAWITGVRRSQSATRKDAETVEWDPDFGLVKFNPLARWETEQVWRFIHQNHIPYNALHDKGFPSIGCLPCTRAVRDGEDPRSGRWWWELPGKRECGLHKRNSDEA